MQRQLNLAPATLLVTTSPEKTAGYVCHTGMFSIFNKLTNLLGNLESMSLVHTERNELKKLTDQELKDIGVRPEEAQTEASRGFFDIPDERRVKR